MHKARIAHLLGPYRVLHGNRHLMLLLAGQAAARLGEELSIVVLAVVVYTITHSATAVALLMFVRLLPYALFLPLSGALTDRWNRRALLVGAQSGRGLCLLGLMVVHSSATLWLAFALVFFAALLLSVYRPALQAVVPAMVGEQDLVPANSVMSQIDSLARVVGPSLASILVVMGANRAAFALAGTTTILAAVLLSGVRVPPGSRSTRPVDSSWIMETFGGFHFLFRENAGVLAACTMTLAGLTLLGGAFYPLAVVLSDQTFALGEGGTGWLDAAYGTGGVIGGFLLGAMVRRRRVGALFTVAAAASSIAAGLFGLSPAGTWPFVLQGVLGTADVAAQITGTRIMQLATPGHLLGRVFGAFEATLVSAMLLGTLLVGPLITLLGPRGATVGLALVGLAMWLVNASRLRRLEQALGVRLFLRQVPILASLSLHMLDDLAARLRVETFAAQATIVREGEPGDRLYIVKHGTVEVIAGGNNGQQVVVATLGELDYFGKIALLRDVPRTATVQSCGPVELYSLSRTDFQTLLQRSNELKAALMGTSDTRYLATQTMLLLRR